MSPRNYRASLERTAGPVAKAVSVLAENGQELAEFRQAIEALTERWFEGNRVRQSFLMTRATRR